MSAAEKLKALDEAIHLDMPLMVVKAGDELVRWCSPVEADALSVVRRALPQIVAVTLWAEQTIQNFDEYGEVSFIPLIDALEELDKALS